MKAQVKKNDAAAQRIVELEDLVKQWSDIALQIRSDAEEAATTFRAEVEEARTAARTAKAGAQITIDDQRKIIDAFKREIHDLEIKNAKLRGYIERAHEDEIVGATPPPARFMRGDLQREPDRHYSASYNEPKWWER